MKCKHLSAPFRGAFTASVRARLTLWYLLVIAGIICIFGGSFYATEMFLNPNMPQSYLENQQAQEVQRLTILYTRSLQSGQNPATQHFALLSQQEIVLLLNPGGKILDTRGSLTSSAIQQLQAQAASPDQVIELSLAQAGSTGWHDNATYRVAIEPLLQEQARVAVLMVGMEQQRNIQFWQIWLFNGLMALLIAAIGGYWLAGKALRPVKMITHTAQEINATDLRRRLHLRRKDEFGELAATFDQMLARLEAAFKRQAQFTADASHELRTPLTIIDLEVNRALTQLERPEEYCQALKQIQAENEQMAQIVNSLLLLARADTGQIVLHLQEVDLSDVVLACVERLVPLACQRQVVMATGALPELLMSGDPHYLGQMLTNVIENGIKYTAGVGQQVRVELVCERERRGVVRIQDDGPGIAAEHLPYLFERFYRVDKARARHEREISLEPGGTGLGLAIAQWIASAHGGEIHVKSQVGAGSLFEIYLPLSGPKTP